MNDLKQFKAERNRALFSLDEQKIRDMLNKWSETNVVHPASENSKVFWVGVHKAITGCTDLPIEFRRKSKAWLDERGFKSLDDGDL